MISEQTYIDNKHLTKAAQRKYAKQQNCVHQDSQDELIKQFMPMVYMIAKKVVTYLKPPLTFEDMISAGTIGLVMAARDFDASHGAEFKTYAYIRIKGAILDELRSWSFVPAGINKKIQNARRVSQEIMDLTGIAPTDEQLANALRITIEELYDMFEAARAQHFSSLDDSDEDNPALGKSLMAENTSRPETYAQKSELLKDISAAIQQLPEKSRQVILLYYTQNLTMKQIAEVLEITESRVSQIHSSALFNMSIKMRQWNDE